MRLNGSLSGVVQWKGTEGIYCTPLYAALATVNNKAQMLQNYQECSVILAQNQPPPCVLGQGYGSCPPTLPSPVKKKKKKKSTSGSQ